MQGSAAFDVFQPDIGAQLAEARDATAAATFDVITNSLLMVGEAGRALETGLDRSHGRDDYRVIAAVIDLLILLASRQTLLERSRIIQPLPDLLPGSLDDLCTSEFQFLSLRFLPSLMAQRQSSQCLYPRERVGHRQEMERQVNPNIAHEFLTSPRSPA
ncbi:hypothetical protein UB46_10970 [Burkholderiaceae bacterium 16]|nr:hypothetical protein UB46_10970 [Burkholderiaceae bacterium 16]